jgi:hypothetical protein
VEDLMKKRIVVWMHIALLAAVSTVLLPARVGRAVVQETIGRFLPVGTAITYQGRLTSAGIPVSGSYDLQFRLYDAEAGGAQVGVTVEKSTVAVQNGLFAVTLDFGAGAFTGGARWMDIGMRETGNPDPYTVLEPRQPITPVPYAVSAGDFSGTLAGDVTGGQGDTSVVGIQGFPVSTAAPSAGAALKFDGSAWVPGTDAGKYANLLVVAKRGGDFATIADALDSITDNDADHRYLVKVAPGTYTEQVAMKPFVDIEGSGKNTTTIVNPVLPGPEGTVLGSDNAEIRQLTIRSESESPAYPAAVYNSSASPSIRDVNIFVSGRNSSAIFNRNSSPTADNLSIVASYPADNGFGYVIYNNPNSGITLSNSTIEMSGSRYQYALYASDHSTFSFANVKITGTDAGYSVYGVSSDYYSTGSLRNVTMDLEGGASYNYGIETYQYSSVDVSNSEIRLDGGAWGYGLRDQGYGYSSFRDVNISISGTTDTSYGIYFETITPEISGPIVSNSIIHVSSQGTSIGIYNMHSSPIISDTIITSSGGQTSIGIENYGSCVPTIRNSSVTASGGTADAYGIYTYHYAGMHTIPDMGGGEISNSTIQAVDAVSNYGIYSVANPLNISYWVTIVNSQIVAGTNTFYSSINLFGFHIGATLLSGGPIEANGGSYICAGVFDETYTFFAGTCP